MASKQQYNIRYLYQGETFQGIAEYRYSETSALMVIVEGDHKNILLNSWNILSKEPISTPVLPPQKSTESLKLGAGGKLL